VQVAVRSIEINCTQERMTVTRKGLLLPAYWTVGSSQFSPVWMEPDVQDGQYIQK
jgi:hypothetical protein